jgi:mobilization protein
MIDKFTSINFQPCKVESSEIHNTRAKELSYVFKDYSNENEHFYFPFKEKEIDFATGEKTREVFREVHYLKQYDARCRELYTEKTNQKVQEGTHFLKEAVVVIHEGTTMEELVQLAKKIEEASAIEVDVKKKVNGKMIKTGERQVMPGWKPLQIHIHRDEGNTDNPEGVFERNWHAHIVFYVQDKETGKSLKLAPRDMVKLQDITAEVLKMKRGERSGRVHMESHEYKITAQLEKVKKLEAQNKALLRKVKELEVQKQELEEIVGDLDLECTNLAQENEELKIKIQENKSQFDEIYEMNRQEYQEKAKKLTKEEANLKASIQELTSKNIELKEIVKRLNINIDKVEECTVNNLEQTLTNLTKSIKKCYPNEIERDIFYNQAKTYLNHFKSKEPNTAATAIHMNILKLAGEARRLQRLEKKKGMGI